jgi:hypothetical protein
LMGSHQGAVAFPVNDQNGIIIGQHYLADRDKKIWLYSKGSIVSALVIGNVQAAKEFHIHESTWDGLAFCDRSQAYLSSAICTIITRGAQNAKIVRGLVPAGKKTYVWPQNDEPSERWCNAIKENLDGSFYRVQTPLGHKDLNDWTRRDGAGKEDLDYAIKTAILIGDPPKIYFEVLTPSEIGDYNPPPGTVLIGDNHVVRGGVSIIGGCPGVGKSKLLVAMAEAGATKLDFLGQPVHSNFKTLIIQNENGRYRLKLEFKELNKKLLDQYLRISPPPPYGLRFDKAEYREQVKEVIETFQPSVIGIDPWNAVSRDDKAKDYRETFDLVRDVIPAGDQAPHITIAAHTRKPSKTNEQAAGLFLTC